MKLRLLFILIAAALQSCVTTTLPDGTKIEQSDPAALALAHAYIAAKMPPVQPTK